MGICHMMQAARAGAQRPPRGRDAVGEGGRSKREGHVYLRLVHTVGCMAEANTTLPNKYPPIKN